MKTNLRNENQKKSKRKGYESLLLLLLTISIFITATYAWFTDSAFSKGNKIFAGNLYVDVITSEDSLKQKYNEDYEAWAVDENEGKPFSDYVKEVLKYDLYQRKYSEIDGDSDNYYYITDKDASAINLYNVEPGQVRTLRINYLNTGDLAFRAAGALMIDVDEEGNKKSYTGLETLNLQKEGEDVYHNLNAVTNVEEETSIIDPNAIFNDNLDSEIDNNHYYIEEGLTPQEYKYRANKLLQLQVELDANGTPIIYGGLHKLEENSLQKEYPINEINIDGYIYNNIGGHLEDILEVYIVPKVDKSEPKIIIDPEDEPLSPIDEPEEEIVKGSLTYADPISEVEITNFDRAWLSKDNKYHDLYYFGTISQFAFLMENGPSAEENYLEYTYSNGEVVATGEWLLVRHDAEGNPEPITESDIPFEQYKLMYKDASKSLYEDYQRYLTYAGGYTLPKDALTNEDGYVIKDGVKVKVYDDDDKEYYMASEMGYTDLVLYMPEDASSKYQNASISLSLGVTATQVEYEMDDTGYMLYDKAKRESLPIDDEIKKGSHISYKDLNGDEHKFLVLSIDENGVADIAELINDEEYLTNYYDSNGERPPRPFLSLQSLFNSDGENYYQSIEFNSEDGTSLSGVKYSGSNLQNTYERLISSYSDPQSPMYNFYSKLIEQDSYQQKMYLHSFKNIESYEYSLITDYSQGYFGYYASTQSASSKALYRPLSLEDLYICYGYDNKNKNNLDYTDMYNFAPNIDISNSYSIALADAPGITGELKIGKSIYELNIYYGEIGTSTSYYEDYNICPVFRINLSDIEVEFNDNGYDIEAYKNTYAKDGDLIKLKNDDKLYRVIHNYRNLIDDGTNYVLLFSIDSIGKTSWTDSDNYSQDKYVKYVDDFYVNNNTPFVGQAYGYTNSNVDLMLQKYLSSLKTSKDKKLNSMYQAIVSFSDDDYLSYEFEPSSIVVRNNVDYINNHKSANNQYSAELSDDMKIFTGTDINSIFLYDDYGNNSIVYNYYASSLDDYSVSCKVNLLPITNYFTNTDIALEDFTKFFLNKTSDELNSDDAMWLNSTKTIGIKIPQGYPGDNPEAIQMLAFGYDGSSAFNLVNANEELQVHPCFFIDLNADGIEYEVIEGENLTIDNYYFSYKTADLGDIVKLQTKNGEYKSDALFRVVKRDDNNSAYTLMAMDNFNESAYSTSKSPTNSTYILNDYNFIDKYEEEYGSYISNISGPDYLSSDLNSYINDSYYVKFYSDFGLNSKKIEDNRIIKEINKSFVSNYTNYLYSNNEFISSSVDIKLDNRSLINVGTTYFEPHTNYFKALSINDIADYDDHFGIAKDSSNAINILFNKDDTNRNQSIWLSDIYFDNENLNACVNFCLEVDLDNNTLTMKNALANEKHSVRPVFTISDTCINEYGLEIVVVDEYHAQFED